MEIVIRPYKSKRSIEQNKRLWKIYQEIADNVWVEGRRYDAETWHEYFKGKLIGYNERLLPNGDTLKTPISTTTLNTAEMTEYQNKIQAWGARRGIIWEF
ncbi:TPA: recombination protein NinB [Neisseria weaveri]